MTNRATPDAPPEVVLTPPEIAVLDRVPGGAPPPLKRTASRYQLKVAKLGGYLARASDPPPGNMVVWGGLTRLADFLRGYELNADSCWELKDSPTRTTDTLFLGSGYSDSVGLLAYQSFLPNLVVRLGCVTHLLGGAMIARAAWAASAFGLEFTPTGESAMGRLMSIGDTELQAIIDEHPPGEFRDVLTAILAPRTSG